MSVSTEDFLKGIYQLKVDLHQKANSSNLAARLNISHAAVTDMARKLSGKGLILYQKYKEFILTPEGEKLALQVIRHHRLWELFLSKVLNFPLSEIHNEAELLEHQTSDLLAEKLDEYLGRPEFDPHGDPIPDREGKMPPNNHILLTDAPPGKTFEIARIHYSDQDMVEFFTSNNITLGQKILIEQVFNKGETMALRIGSKPFVLTRTITQNIYLNNIT
ncbi:MAG: metal-dependent transcriptional regulator [Bacteroidetes bacterium]|nr:metal-dependent transcriptional regulator [Bacteroidota bacterium]